MKPKLMGIKQGMMQIFDDQGNRVVCTVILAEPHVVTQIKSKESDGYIAVQLASLDWSGAVVRHHLSGALLPASFLERN